MNFIFDFFESLTDRFDGLREKHTCPKPIKFCVDVLRGVNQGDLVLDIFGGSGSTLIACEQTNRTCYMMEIDPKYCDVIRKRFDNFVKK